MEESVETGQWVSKGRVEENRGEGADSVTDSARGEQIGTNKLSYVEKPK